jgi:DNA-binding response OmpR family regulator
LVASLLLLTNTLGPASDVLSALSVLPHRVRTAPAEASALLAEPAADAILVDGRRDLPQVRSLCRLIRTTGVDVPVLLIVTEGALVAVSADWGADDVILETAGPAELEARLRICAGRLGRAGTQDTPDEIRSGDVRIDEATYTARVRGRVLDLTFKEFELLKFLAQHPGRVFTRAQLLQEVWGYDYFGGTRTVDVHVRRLRAKLGPEHDALIGTVRNVGYRLVAQRTDADRSDSNRPDADRSDADRPNADRLEAGRSGPAEPGDRPASLLT